MRSDFNILIIAPAWVGDMVMAQSLFKVLKRRYPECRIDVLAPAWCAPLLERMNEVRTPLPLEIGHGQLKLGQRRRIGHALRAAQYQHAIVLPNSFKSALIPWWADIPRRTGYVGEWRYLLLNDCRPLERALLVRTVDRFAALGLEPGEAFTAHVPHPHLDINIHGLDSALARLNLDKPTSPLLALCPGAEYGIAKRWPAAHFAAVARHYLALDWQVWLFGSDKDMAMAGAINVDAGGKCHNLCGRTTLAEAVDLLSLAQAVVSNDSGLMHVAAALDKPLVAVYGSSDPNFTPPLSKHAQIVSLGLSCSPCFKRECPLKHLNCLYQLTPSQVITALDTCLANAVSD
jgi:heptosyltransferase II